MKNIDHAALGGVIGTLFQPIAPRMSGWIFWPFYTLVAFLSHPVLDAIPHSHFFQWGKHNIKQNKKEFCYEVGLGAMFILIVFPIMLSKGGVGYFFYYFWAMFWANLPDGLALRWRLFKELNASCHWFEKCQWFEKKNKEHKGGRGYYLRLGIIIIWLYYFLF